MNEVEKGIEQTPDAEETQADAGQAISKIEFQEPSLDFDSTSKLQALTEQLKAENELPQNPMIVGELEQLELNESIFGVSQDLETLSEGESGPTENEHEDDLETDQPLEFIDNDRLISVIESLLFATDKPVSIATIKQIFKGSNIRTKDITRALDHLASTYASAERGVSLEEIHGGYQLRTKVDNTEYLKRLAKVRPFRLSGPALEVLAIAAYKQPITKSEVDQIRGVESGHLMRALMERGLVGFGEKSDLPGKPMTYVTTRKFLETFGLRNLNELPTLAEIDELIPEGIGDPEEKETLSDLTDGLSNEIKSSYSEGEEELESISESLKVIDTTSEFFEQEKIRQRNERERERAQDIREKITVGELVEDKDRKWLARYEAKQEAIAAALERGETVTAASMTVGAADGEPAETVEAQSGEAASADEVGEAMDPDEMALLEELSANPDHDPENDSDQENDKNGE